MGFTHFHQWGKAHRRLRRDMVQADVHIVAREMKKQQTYRAPGTSTQFIGEVEKPSSSKMAVRGLLPEAHA